MAEHVELLLKSLKLPTFVRHYRTLLEEHTEWTPLAYLARLCEYELADRYARRVRNWTREARLPPGKTFASLEPDHLAKSSSPAVRQLMENRDWWHRAENVILVGASGVGHKSAGSRFGRPQDAHRGCARIGAHQNTPRRRPGPPAYRTRDPL